jgi:hypothetical protein
MLCRTLKKEKKRVTIHFATLPTSPRARNIPLPIHIDLEIHTEHK